jgi:hypothetical protein
MFKSYNLWLATWPPGSICERIPPGNRVRHWFRSSTIEVRARLDRREGDRVKLGSPVRIYVSK